MKKIIAFAVASLAVFALMVPTTFAAEFIAPDQESGNVTLSSGEKHHNTYVAGGKVFVNTDITGDLYAAGGTITIEGKIEQDAVVAGGTVTINGTVGGDVRVAGGTVTINGAVTGDVLIAGGTVYLTEKASIGGDLAAASGDMIVDSAIAGNAMIAGGVITLNSKVGGTVKVTADQSFTIGSKAEVAQTINYQGVKEATVVDGAKIGAVDFKKIEQPRGGHAGRVFATIFTITFVIKILAMMLAGLLLMKLFPRTSHAAVGKIMDKPWVNLGVGALVLFVGPIAVIIALISFFGLYIAIGAFLAWLLMLLFAALSSSVFVGSWIVKQLTKKPNMVYDWQALLIGIAVLSIVMLIPIIGGLFFFAILLIAFGAMIRLLMDHSRNEQSAGAVVHNE